MTDSDKSVKLQTASITDRGLNQKRPLNEDSMLADATRHIFAVADGVGGAEAGEVASQTAVEVLSEAFRHQKDGADIEDLMELAIQRANSSIHQMSLEHSKLSMMATTIVALHLNGYRATIGHVGDSRLYRLSPDGKLHRETADHSIVEEEVRAGRMTAEQAANHPSKNVISRALGAEPSVEVDLKIIEVQPGTTFLLCTDGITRHIPDGEIRELLNARQDANNVCEEMKRRCYQRGAEDNLTAIIVRVGERKQRFESEEEPTLSLEIPEKVAAEAAGIRSSATRISVPASQEVRPASAPAATRPGRMRGVMRFFLFLFFIAAVAGAFYGGAYYQKRMQALTANTTAAAPVSTPTPDTPAEFETKRSAVDANPQKWMDDNLQTEMRNSGVNLPGDMVNPESLYLYGRALMLTGRHQDAVGIFEKALTAAVATDPSRKLSLAAETRMALAAAELRLKNQDPNISVQDSRLAEERAMRLLEESINLKTEHPTPTPQT